MYPSSFDQWWAHFSPVALDALQLAGLFVSLSLWMYRKNLREALRKVLPASLRFNLIVYAFDTALVLLPLIHLATVAADLLKAHGLVLLGGAHFAELPHWLTIAIAIFVGDLVAYFRHRLEHSRLLWPSHVMHHSDAHMNWTTVYRFHPINRLTTVVIDYGSLVALGFPSYAIILGGAFRYYYGMFIHADVPWTYGRLGGLFVSPAMHRWHHVREGEGVGSNFASVFAVFDRAFGTWYLPGPCERPLGVTEVDNDSVVKQMLLPFTRAVKFLSRRGKTATPVDDGASATP